MKNRASKTKQKDALLRLFKATCCYSSMPRTFFDSSSAGGRILHAFNQDKTHNRKFGQPFPFISEQQNPSGSFNNLGCWMCPPGRLHWRTELPKTSLVIKSRRLFRRKNQSHTTASFEKLRLGQVNLHYRVLCRVNTFRHNPVPWLELLLSHKELCKGAVCGICLQDIRKLSLVGTTEHQERRLGKT